MDMAENKGGCPALAGTPGSPIGSPSHHTVLATESQQLSYNSRKCEKVDGQDTDAVLDKNTETLDESSLASEPDMFDIELQKEYQAISLRSTMPSAGNNNAGVGMFTWGHTKHGVSSVPHVTGAVRWARGHPEVSPPTMAASDPGKRFSSVAGAYQLSTFTQDLEKSVHLVHTLAQDIRREMQIVGNASYSNIADNPATGGAKSGRASPAVAPSLSSTFVEDLRLVTMVVQDINQSYHLNFGSPFSPGVAPALGGGGAAYPQTSLRGAFPRTSPGGGRSSSCNGVNNNNGRSTIDTEVNDSLRRISHAANSPYYHHDYEIRPVNPHQAAPHGTYTIPPQAPQIQYPSVYFFTHPTTTTTNTNTNNLNGDGASRTPTVVHYLEHVTLGRPGGANAALNTTSTTANAAMTNLGSAAGKKSSAARTSTAAGKEGGGGSPPAQNVAYPLAVKPQLGTTEGWGGRNRGPRSRSGKNVAPSNCSAFSECSGGETRSYKSTATAFPNLHLNSSANVTTNTSLSSNVLYPISATLLTNSGAGGAVSVVNPSGNSAGGDVEGGANKGIGAASPINGITGVKCE